MKSIVLIIITLLILGTLANAVESVLMPNLEGNSSDLAIEYLKELELDPKITWCFSDSVEIGEIIPDSQEPSAGKLVSKGSIVRAEASKGPFPANLIGKTKIQAESNLIEKNISYKIYYGFSETLSIGHVYNQSPREFNECIYQGFEIDLFVNENTKAFVHPESGSSVKSSVKVAGFLKDSIDKDTADLWIAVRPLNSGDNWWPQSGGPLLVEDNHFNGIAHLGGTSNDTFEIAVLMVNKTISDDFAKWEKISKLTNYWPPITKKSKGFVSIPRNAIEEMSIGKVTVILEGDK